MSLFGELTAGHFRLGPLEFTFRYRGHRLRLQVAGRGATLPDSLRNELTTLRVWSPEATIDIASDASAVYSPRPKDSICVLTLAQLDVARARCGL